MRRVLLASATALMLAGCGGGSNAVGANSTDSTEITAVGTIVANEATPTPTPTATETPAAVGNDSAAADDGQPPAGDTATDRSSDGGGNTVKPD